LTPSRAATDVTARRASCCDASTTGERHPAVVRIDRERIVVGQALIGDRRLGLHDQKRVVGPIRGRSIVRQIPYSIRGYEPGQMVLDYLHSMDVRNYLPGVL